MTHNTREVEELKKEFIAEYKAGHKEGGMRSYLFTGQNGSLIADWWIEKLHHQLQKAREEAYQAGRAYEAQQCRGSVADNHPNAPYDLPELDQDVNN